MAQDPFQTLREWLDRAERSLNQRLADRSAGVDASRVRGRLSQAALDLQKVVWELWARYFQSINLPTRTDILRLGKRLAEIEDAIARLEAQLRNAESPRPSASESPRAAPSAAHRPPRTRRPPAAQSPG
jgi:hypothetical protein